MEAGCQAVEIAVERKSCNCVRCYFSSCGQNDWISSRLLEAPLGSMLTAKVHMFSQSVLCTGPKAKKIKLEAKAGRVFSFCI